MILGRYPLADTKADPFKRRCVYCRIRQEYVIAKCNKLTADAIKRKREAAWAKVELSLAMLRHDLLNANLEASLRMIKQCGFPSKKK